MITRKFKLKTKLPFLPKGAVYLFDDETAHVYRVVNGEAMDIPLRIGLASYLWLLMTEDKYMVRVD